MTQKEEKEWSKMVPRFKDVCCSKMCKSWCNCENRDVHNFLSCPWFYGYRTMGWPVKKLSDYSYNATGYVDLRVEEASQELIDEWRNKK